MALFKFFFYVDLASLRSLSWGSFVSTTVKSTKQSHSEMLFFGVWWQWSTNYSPHWGLLYCTSDRISRSLFTQTQIHVPGSFPPYKHLHIYRHIGFCRHNWKVNQDRSWWFQMSSPAQTPNKPWDAWDVQLK